MMTWSMVLWNAPRLASGSNAEPLDWSTANSRMASAHLLSMANAVTTHSRHAKTQPSRASPCACVRSAVRNSWPTDSTARTPRKVTPSERKSTIRSRPGAYASNEAESVTARSANKGDLGSIPGWNTSLRPGSDVPGSTPFHPRVYRVSSGARLNSSSCNRKCSTALRANDHRSVALLCCRRAKLPNTESRTNRNAVTLARPAPALGPDPVATVAASNALTVLTYECAWGYVLDRASPRMNS